MAKESNDTPSKFLHQIGPGITPVITSHGDINFFEKSFEKALAPASDGSSRLPPLKGVPALNSKLKLNSIQLISPPSDSGNISTNTSAPDFNMNLQKTGGPQVLSNHTDTYLGTVMPSQQIRFYDPKYAVEAATNLPQTSMHLLHGPSSTQIIQGPVQMDHANSMWAASIQQAKASSLEKQLRFQEKNRIAAMKSRQRKKREWERLQASEQSLLDENRVLSERVAILESEVRILREASNSHKSPS